VFVFLAIVGAVILAVSMLTYTETLPAEHRASGGFGRSRSDFRTLLTDRVYRGVLLNQGPLWAAVFAYLAGATFVLQDIYGLSPQWYAAAFGLNSAGFAFFGWLAGRSAEHWSITGTLHIGIALAGLGALGLLAAGLTHLPLVVVLASFFALASGVATSTPPATTLALADYPHMAGTASSLLGMVRFGFGGIAAPLVGIAGAHTILPLGIVTLTAVTLSALALNRTRHTATSAALPGGHPDLTPACEGA
jgi:DHA1 family bicyclomycin/chloramphenicol resistance-like MFS transporter